MLNCNFQYSRHDFNLDIQFSMQTQILGLSGISGSGKSTILKSIVGLVTPDTGCIQFQSQCLFDRQAQINVPLHQRKIALIFQNTTLFPHFNVQQNLLYASRWSRQKAITLCFEHILELLELTSLLKRQAYQLSGGEAQRVAIGRALLSSPQLLLLDEPLSGLDIRFRQQILGFLKNIKKETNLPMIYVSHHPEEIEFLEGDIVQLDQGKIQSILYG